MKSTSRSNPHPIILCTDFGISGPYTGQMKLAIAQISPSCQIIDLAHDIPPQNLQAAYLILRQSLKLLPHPCIVCAVVDPSVGSHREILSISFESGTKIVIPNNGLYSAFEANNELGSATTIIKVINPAYQNATVSPVFHGRDIFAPAAAHLANGISIEKLGPHFQKEPQKLAICQPIHHTNHISGEILYLDHFGNAITNISMDEQILNANTILRIKGHELAVRQYYAQANPKELIALTGSFDTLEVAVRNGSAREQLDIKEGEPVEVWFKT